MHENAMRNTQYNKVDSFYCPRFLNNNTIQDERGLECWFFLFLSIQEFESGLYIKNVLFLLLFFFF